MNYNSKKSGEIQDKIFKVQNLKPEKGDWWWWFLLLFFDSPRENPAQLMILWSTKQDKKIECNGKEFAMHRDLKGSKRDGAVASWYFDGEKMHHNFLLNHSPLFFDKNQIETKEPFTKFSGSSGNYSLRIGKDMKFKLALKEKNQLTMPSFDSREILGQNYQLLRMNRLALNGKIGKKSIKGSAYFQRVFLNAPALPWYWGIFHFKKAILTYFRIHTGFPFNIPIKQDVALYDGHGLHRFDKVKVMHNGKKFREFLVQGFSEKERIMFKVSPYERSDWVFRKRLFGFGPKTTLKYREFPAKIKCLDLNMEDKMKEYGEGVGNAEYTSGFLT